MYNIMLYTCERNVNLCVCVCACVSIAKIDLQALFQTPSIQQFYNFKTHTLNKDKHIDLSGALQKEVLNDMHKHQNKSYCATENRLLSITASPTNRM